MAKPVLYLDVVGTLLTEKGSGYEIAAFARVFVEGVKRIFEIRLLTTLEEHQALGVAKALDFQATYVPYRHALGKVSAIDFREVFFWVDDDPLPGDLLRLSDERCSDRLIPVSRREGVTEATLRKLLATWEQVRAQQAGGSTAGG
jgi:hypothetical protein